MQFTLKILQSFLKIVITVKSKLLFEPLSRLLPSRVGLPCDVIGGTNASIAISSEPASCVESDLEEGSENVVVPYQYEPEEKGSESESSDESQNDGRLLNTEWLVSCVC